MFQVIRRLLVLALAPVVLAVAPAAQAVEPNIQDTLVSTPSAWEPVASAGPTGNPADLGLPYIHLAWTSDGKVAYGRINHLAFDRTNSLLDGVPFGDDGSRNQQVAVSGLHVYVAFEQQVSLSCMGVFVKASSTGGDSWSAPQLISGNDCHATNLHIAAAGDRVYAVWQDGPFVAVRGSENAGADWGPFKDIPAELPGIAVTPAAVFVSYRDWFEYNGDQVVGGGRETIARLDNGTLSELQLTPDCTPDGPCAQTLDAPVLASGSGGLIGAYHGADNRLMLIEAGPHDLAVRTEPSMACRADPLVAIGDQGNAAVACGTQVITRMAGATMFSSPIDHLVPISAVAAGNGDSEFWMTQDRHRLTAVSQVGDERHSAEVQPQSEDPVWTPAIAGTDRGYVAAWTQHLGGAVDPNAIEPNDFRVIARPVGLVPTRISLDAAELVQAPYGSDRLVVGKQTGVHVRIAADLPISRYVRLQIQYTDGSSTSRTTEAVLIQPGMNDLTLPDVRFRPEGSLVQYTVKIVHDDYVSDTTIARDQVDGTATAYQTGRLRVFVVPVRIVGDTAPQPTCTDVERMAETSKPYLAAAFPVDDRAVEVLPECSWHPRVSKSDFARQTHRMFQYLSRAVDNPTYERVIGVVRDGAFRDLAQAASDLAAHGMTELGGAPAAILESSAVGGWPMAHELAHIDGLKSTTTTASGFWLDNHVVMHGPDILFGDTTTGDLAKSGRWIDPTTWSNLIDRRRAGLDSFAAVRRTAAATPATSGTWQLSGVVNGDGTLDLAPLQPGGSDPGAAQLGTQGATTLQYLAADGSVLSTAAIDTSTQLEGLGGGERPSDGFTVVIPAVDGTAALSIVRDGKELARLTRSAHTPTVSITAPAAGEEDVVGQTLHVAWTASDADGDPLSTTVSMSRDGGTTWTPLDVDPGASSTDLELGPEAAGANVRVRVQVSDGWGTAQAISDPFVVHPQYGNGLIAYTKETQYLVNGSNAFPERIMLGDPATGETHVISEPPGNPADADSQGRVARHIAPHFSPDGTQIAYIRIAPTGTRELWVMNADGSNQRQLVADLGTNPTLSIEWSRDGKTIYKGGLPSVPDNATVLKVDAATGAVSQITFPGFSQVDTPQEAADGTHLIALAWPAGSGTNPSIYQFDADGTNPIVLFSWDQFHPQSSLLSPDGTKILALLGFTGGSQHYHVLDVATRSDLGQATTQEGWVSPQRWQPTSDGLLGRASCGSASEPALMPVTGSTFTCVSGLVLGTNEGMDQQPVPNTVAHTVQATVTAPAHADEGTAFTVSAAATTPGLPDSAFHWDLNGDGTFNDATGPQAQVKSTLAGPLTVAVEVTPDSGTPAVATATTTIDAVAPTVHDLVAARDPDGTTRLTGTLQNPGTQNAPTATIDWGDGSASEPANLISLPGGGQRVVGLHHYGEGAVHTVTVTVQDNAGHSTSATVDTTAAPEHAPTLADAHGATIDGAPTSIALAPQDVDGDPVAVRIVRGPRDGTADIVSGASPTSFGPQLVYEPRDPTATGADDLVVEADDNRGGTVRATVTIDRRVSPASGGGTPAVGGSGGNGGSGGGPQPTGGGTHRCRLPRSLPLLIKAPRGHRVIAVAVKAVGRGVRVRRIGTGTWVAIVKVRGTTSSTIVARIRFTFAGGRHRTLTRRYRVRCATPHRTPRPPKRRCRSAHRPHRCAATIPSRPEYHPKRHRLRPGATGPRTLDCRRSTRRVVISAISLPCDVARRRMRR